MHYLTWVTGGISGYQGSRDRPDDPGGQVGVAHPGLAGSGEHLDVAGLGVADVHHDRAVRRVLVMAGPRGLARGPRAARGARAGRGRRAQRPAERRYGESRGARGRRSPDDRTPGRALGRGSLCVVTGHDDPFGNWSARTTPAREGHAGKGQWWMRDGDPVAAATTRGGAHAGSRPRWPSLATGSPVTRCLRRSPGNGWVGRQKISVTFRTHGFYRTYWSGARQK